MVTRMTGYRPLDVTDAKRCAYLVGSLAVALNHSAESIKIRVFKTPTVYVRNGLCMMEYAALASLQRNCLSMAEYLFA